MKKLVSVFLSMIVLLSMFVFPAVSENGSSQNTAAEAEATETGAGANKSSGDQTGEEGTFPASAIVTIPIGEGDMVGILSGKTSLGTWEYEVIGDSQYFAYSSSVPGTEISVLYMFPPKPEDIMYSTAEGMKSAAESVSSVASGNLENYTSEFMEIDGYPVILATGSRTSDGTKVAYGVIAACSRSHLIIILLTSPSTVYSPTIEDMRQLAGYFSLDTSQPLITEAQVGLTLSTEDGVTSVSAGQKLKFIASFADPSIVNAQAKNNRIKWGVMDSFDPETETGYYSKDAKIDNRASCIIQTEPGRRRVEKEVPHQ